MGEKMALVRNEVGREVEILENKVHGFMKRYPRAKLLRGSAENPLVTIVDKFTADELRAALKACGKSIPKKPSKAAMAGLLIDEGGAEFIQSVINTQHSLSGPEEEFEVGDEDDGEV